MSVLNNSVITLTRYIDNKTDSYESCFQNTSLIREVKDKRILSKTEYTLEDICFLISVTKPIKKNMDRTISQHIQYHYKHLNNYKKVMKRNKHLVQYDDITINNYKFFMELCRVVETDLENINIANYGQENLHKIKSAFNSLFIFNFLNNSNEFISLKNILRQQYVSQPTSVRDVYYNEILDIINGNYETSLDFFADVLYLDLIDNRKYKDVCLGLNKTYSKRELKDIIDEAYNRINTKNDTIEICINNQVKEYQAKCIVETFASSIPLHEDILTLEDKDITSMLATDSILSSYNKSFANIYMDSTKAERYNALIHSMIGNVDYDNRNMINTYSAHLALIMANNSINRLKESVMNSSIDLIKELWNKEQERTKDIEYVTKCESKVKTLETKLKTLKNEQKQMIVDTKTKAEKDAYAQLNADIKKYKKQVSSLTHSLNIAKTKLSENNEVAVTEITTEKTFSVEDILNLKINVAFISNENDINNHDSIKHLFNKYIKIDSPNAYKTFENIDIILYDEIAINHNYMKYVDIARSMNIPVVYTNTTNTKLVLEKILERLKND